MTPNSSRTSSTEISANSTTAAPASRSRRTGRLLAAGDRVERTADRVLDLRLEYTEDSDDQDCRHDRDHHPAGHITSFPLRTVNTVDHASHPDCQILQHRSSS